MTDELADLLRATIAQAIDTYVQKRAEGYGDLPTRAFATLSAMAWAEGFTEGFAEVRAGERARLKALHDGFAVHGDEAQRWLMAIELGSPPDDGAEPPPFTLSN